MKKSILTLAFGLLSLSPIFSANLKIVNNTNSKQKIEIWLSGVAFYLNAGEQMEFEVGNRCSFNTEFGVATVETEDDTTLEINPDCYYIGETKYFYWGEN